MDKPTSFTLQVADVVIVQRQVQCPTVCPHCEADLVSEDGQITVLLDQLDEIAEHATISKGDDGELFEESLETEGSDSVATLDIRCDSCQKSILDAPGTMRNTLPDGRTLS